MHSIIIPMMQEAQNAYFFPQVTTIMASTAKITLPTTLRTVKYRITHTCTR